MLFVLKPIKNWEPWYDKAFCFVVRASSEKEARQLASSECGSEGKQVWLDEHQTTCVRVQAKGPAEVLCSDFRGA